MSRGIYIDIENCSGCRTCEMACSFKKTGEFNPERARIRIINFFKKAYFVPTVCSQCSEAWCHRICPTGAISIKYDKDHDTKTIEVDEKICVGCKMCIMACPFGSMSYAEDERKAVKCDLCDGEPECVKYCAKNCLTFKDLNDGLDQKRRINAEKLLASQE